MNLNELLQKKNSIKIDAENLLKDGKVLEAEAKVTEIENLNKQIEVLARLEESQKQTAQSVIDSNNLLVSDFIQPSSEQKNSVARSALNKIVRKKALTDAENAIATDGQIESTDGLGGFLVPTEFIPEIIELRRNIKSLKTLCNVVSVHSDNGEQPIEVENFTTLVETDELAEISLSTNNFGQIKYDIKDKFDLVQISRQLLNDSKFDIVSYCMKKFQKKAIRTENKDILAVLNTATVVTGTDYKTINTVFNTEIDVEMHDEACIITHQTGFDYLDGLEDKNGRPLLKEDLTKKCDGIFNGKPVIIVNDSDVTVTAGSYAFFVGSVSDFVTFFDREQIAMEQSREAGFTKHAVLIKTWERYDVKKVDDKAMRKVVITPKAVARTASAKAAEAKAATDKATETTETITE